LLIDPFYCDAEYAVRIRAASFVFQRCGNKRKSEGAVALIKSEAKIMTISLRKQG